MVVAEKLDLDMLGLIEETLDKDGAISEGGLGLGSGSLKGLLEGFGVTDNPHAAAATAEGGLDDDGEAVFIGEVLDVLKLVNGAVCAGDDGNLGGDGEFPGGYLVAERVDDVWSRTDELR